MFNKIQLTEFTFLVFVCCVVISEGKEMTIAVINYGLYIGTVFGWDTYLRREKEKH